MKDPWAEEEQSANDFVVDSALDEMKENNSMSNNQNEAPFCLTLKMPGKDEPWLVIRAWSVDELASLLEAAVNSVLFDTVRKAQRAFAGSPASQPAQGQQSYQGRSQAPQQSAPQGDGRTCAHGAMTYREGTKKDGNQYKAYFCPERDRNQQCRPIWLS